MDIPERAVNKGKEILYFVVPFPPRSPPLDFFFPLREPTLELNVLKSFINLQHGTWFEAMQCVGPKSESMLSYWDKLYILVIVLIQYSNVAKRK